MPPSPDLSLVQDMSQPLGPDLLARCELPYDVRNIDKVSTGTVTVMTAPSDPMVFTAEVDATAGGSMKYGENPFVYLDLIGRKKSTSPTCSRQIKVVGTLRSSAGS